MSELNLALIVEGTLLSQRATLSVTKVADDYIYSGTIDLKNVAKDNVLSVATFFGFKGISVFLSSGGRLKPDMLPKSISGNSLVNNCDLILCGKLKMDEDPSAFTKTMNALFGVTDLDLYIAKSGNNFNCFFMLPSFDNNVLSGKNIMAGVGFGGTPQFSLSGDFRFSIVRDLLFQLNCSFSLNSVNLSAYAESKMPIPLLGPFKIGNTALSIGYKPPSLTFGMVSTLYIGDIALFGAIMLSFPPIKISLVALAVHELTIPLLIQNLCGVSFNGLNAFDFIKILGFDLTLSQNFNKDAVAKKDMNAIVAHFNQYVAANNLHLTAGNVELQSYKEGVGLVDRNTLRCYYIEKANGKLSLQAQCYFSDVPSPMKIGVYTINPGIFICGVISIFNIRLKVLFSFVKNDGVMAFAQLDPIDLGFIKLSGSKQAAANPIPLPKDSVLKQFLGDEKPNGLLFYMNVNKTKQTFYLSGRLVLLYFFEFDALVSYESGEIYIAVTFPILLIFTATINLRVSYSNFNNKSFQLLVRIDTSKLEQALKAVTDNINKAIAKLQQSIDAAVYNLRIAQNNVLGLQSQIDSLNWRINDCRNAIRRARWYQFWIPIAKGLEIAAYEVAKLGIYAAIGIAYAALKVAEACVKIGGAIGKGALQLVNGVIKVVTSLFFLKKIEFVMNANQRQQVVAASIEFIALGKTYNISTSFDLGNKNSDYAKNQLSSGINNNIQRDLDNLGKDNFMLNADFAELHIPIKEHHARLHAGMDTLTKGTAMLSDMQEIYYDNVDEYQPSLEEVQQYYLESLGNAQASLETVRRLDLMNDVNQMMDLLSSANDSDFSALADEVEGLNSLTADLSGYMDNVDLLINNVRGDIEKQQTLARETAMPERLVNSTPSKGQIEAVLNGVENLVAGYMPQDNATLFTNLALEPIIPQFLDKTREYYNLPPSDKVTPLRNANYSPRIDFGIDEIEG